ncbi:hypothetical protein PIROE2DRAFT_16965 [Piromyces sp. E2]|nr:hypothetical protein PIROE2DRAFT_16965 [Piromyces sp. E2]|eukprot:OUM57900.1 hypothetical protein PIROE2DRAFT_16965 [Piromyces sp. E2]
MYKFNSLYFSTTDNDGYYLDESSLNSNSYSTLIKCDSIKYASLDIINIGYYLDGSSTNNNISYSGYYSNESYNKDIEQLINCTPDKNCDIIDNPIIVYDNKGSICTSQTTTEFHNTENSKTEDYYYNNNKLLFHPMNNSDTEFTYCIPNIYVYNLKNHRAIFCNNGNLEYSSFTGYVIDGDHKINNSNSYLNKRENNGRFCTTIKP